VDVEDTITCPSAPFDYSEITSKLQKSRLDREKLSILNHAIKSTMPGLEDQLLQKVSVSYLDIQSSLSNF
jgi:hypothetical protein